MKPIGEVIEELLTPCVHDWKNYRANDILDSNCNPTRYRNLVYYPEGEPHYRICSKCKKKQVLTWKDL